MSTQTNFPVHDLKHSTCYRRDGKIVIEIAEDDVIDCGENPFVTSGGGPMGRFLKVEDRETFLDAVTHNLSVHCREGEWGCETWTRIAVKKAGEQAAEEEKGAKEVDISEQLNPAPLFELPLFAPDPTPPPHE